MISVAVILVICTNILSTSTEPAYIEESVKFPVNSPSQRLFRPFSALLCDNSAKFTSLQCPRHMEVRLFSAIYGHAKAMLSQEKALRSVDLSDSPMVSERRRHSRKRAVCFNYLKTDQNSALPQTFPADCGYGIRDLAVDIQAKCKNNHTCDISKLKILKPKSSLTDGRENGREAIELSKTNRNSCSLQHYLFVQYTCVPSQVKTELILADSYLELECLRYPNPPKRILVVSAFLTANTSLNPGEKVDRSCPDMDKTSDLSSTCNRKESCTAEPPKSSRHMIDRGCRKMNLKLTYACIQDSFFVPSLLSPSKDNRRGKITEPSQTRKQAPNTSSNSQGENSNRESTFHPDPGSAINPNYRDNEKSRESTLVSKRFNLIHIIVICVGVIGFLMLVLIAIFVIRRVRSRGRRSNANEKSGSSAAKRNHRSKSNSLSKMYGPDGSEKFLPPASPHLPPAPRYHGVDLLPYNTSLTLTDGSNPLSGADTYSENLSSPPLPPHYHENMNVVDACLLPPPMPFASSISANLTNQMYASHHQDSNFSLPLNNASCTYQMPAPLSRASTSSTSGGSTSTFYTLSKKDNPQKETIVTLPYNTSHLPNASSSLLTNPNYSTNIALTSPHSALVYNKATLESWH